MKFVKNWKKQAAAVMAAIMLTGSLTMPAMAHGHGSSHHSSYSSRTYCSYHGAYHSKKTNCTKYCTVHKTTHANGRRHHH